MGKPHDQPSQPLPAPLPLPGWIARAAAEPLDAAAFRSGAALAHLALVAAADVPLPLWRDRLALAAAETCAGIAGRREGARALRDALYLTRPGDDPGPAGRILRQWSRAVARPPPVAGLARVLEAISPERIGPAQAVLRTRPFALLRIQDVLAQISGFCAGDGLRGSSGSAERSRSV